MKETIRRLNLTLNSLKDKDDNSDKIDYIVMTIDNLDSKILARLFSDNSNDTLILESILIVLKKRTDEDNIFLFIENLFHTSRNIRFLCFTYLFEKNIFTSFRPLLLKYMEYENDRDIICFVESIFKDERNLDDNKNESQNISLKEAILEKLQSSDKNTVMTAAFRIKNLNFPGKKEAIFRALSNSNDIHTVQNLLYALNTEKIQKEDASILNNILSEKPFYKILTYDINMLKLNDFTQEKESTWTKKIATLLAAVIR